MGPGADPHSFGISAQEAAEPEQADLVVHNGFGLEEGVERHVRTAQSRRSSGLRVRREGRSAHDRGPDSQPDPHFWIDPSRVARAAVDLITDQVVAHVGGVHAAAVKTRAAQHKGEVLAVGAEMAQGFERIPPERRKLVTNPHVLGGLAQRYGFEVIGAAIPSRTTLASPSASDLSSLAGVVQRSEVRTTFADSSQPGRWPSRSDSTRRWPAVLRVAQRARPRRHCSSAVTRPR